MEKYQKKIVELEKLLSETRQRNIELERELKELKEILWGGGGGGVGGYLGGGGVSLNSRQDRSISNEFKEEGRYRAKTIIDSTVIENLRIAKEEIQLKVTLFSLSFSPFSISLSLTLSLSHLFSLRSK